MRFHGDAAVTCDHTFPGCIVRTARQSPLAMTTDNCTRGALSLQEESSDPFSGKPWAVAALAYVTAYGWFGSDSLP